MVIRIVTLTPLSLMFHHITIGNTNSNRYNLLIVMINFKFKLY